jgi:hypothetical protein
VPGEKVSAVDPQFRPHKQSKRVPEKGIVVGLDQAMDPCVLVAYDTGYVGLDYARAGGSENVGGILTE